MGGIVVIGGTGFVGRHLARMRHAAIKDAEITFVAHRGVPPWLEAAAVPICKCSLGASDLAPILATASAVINLLRPNGDGECLSLVEGILAALPEHGVRFVHASTIDIYSDAQSGPISELTEIGPSAPYAREHAAIEEAVLGLESSLVLRLGAVFGDGGRNIVSFAREAKEAPLVRLALRRILYGSRPMHLVSVDTVVRALFDAACTHEIPPRVRLVTEDHDEDNNFGFMQDVLSEYFGRPRLNFLPAIPDAMLVLLLRALGRPYAGAGRRYITAFPEACTWHRGDFSQRLREYAQMLSASSS